MKTTQEWAESLGIATCENLAPIPDYLEPHVRTSRDIAIRSILLQGICAIAYNVDSEEIIKWFHDQGIYSYLTPKELAFIGTTNPAESEQINYQWKQETQWTLLWMIQKVESIGLPTKFCDTARLADEIMPALGDDIESFLNQSELRSPGAFLAEDDRTYNLWCYALATQKRGGTLPSDFNLRILYERRYAFEWMDGMQDWDNVTCDA